MTVSPGSVGTRMWLGPDGVAERLTAQAGTTAGEVVAEASAAIPRGRFPTAEEVAGVPVVTAGGGGQRGRAGRRRWVEPGDVRR